MKDKYFSRTEIPSTGTRVKTVVPYADVPVGTTGVVIGDWQTCGGGWGVEVKWQRFPGDTLTDGFSKTDYEEGLEEI